MRIIPKLAEAKIRFDRGVALTNWLKNVILIVAGVKYLIDLSVMMSLIAGIIVTLGVYFLGWLDLDIIKLFQKEAELGTGKYNPFFKRLKKRFK